MVYFAGCNFRCRFCVQAPDCFDPQRGVEAAAAALAADMRSKIDRGARTINLIGGEPSIHLHTILELAAADAERCGATGAERLPLMLNSNMYMTPEVIDALAGIITVYIADFKFGNDGCGRAIAGVERYVETVSRNLLHASACARVIVRHLVMPGHLDCCLRPVAAWIAAHLPTTEFTLMQGYSPSWRATSRAGSTPELARFATQAEADRAEEIVAEYGLRRSA